MISIGSIKDVRGVGLPVNRIEAPSEDSFKWLLATVKRDYNPSVFIACDRTLVTVNLPQEFLESLKIRGFSVHIGNESRKKWYEIVASLFTLNFWT